MTIKELLAKGESIISTSSNSSQLDVEILLSHVLGKKKSYLFSHQDEVVSPIKEKGVLKLINRRVKHTPIAYLTNKKEFYSLEFYIDENVLIPRPETEQLVDMVLDEVKQLKPTKSRQRKAIKLIDVGTGCGNIGISIIHEILERKLNNKYKFEIYLTDISSKALQVAKKNYKKLIKQPHNIKVHFVQTDLFENMNVYFDIVVSNPPYIPKRDIEYLDPNVREYEPHIALDGGVGGYKIIKRLIKESIRHLSPKGILFFEMHERYPNEVWYFLEVNFPGFKVKFYKDCFDRWRFAKISRQESVISIQVIGK